MTTRSIREELADRYGYGDTRKVCCINCKYWGYNNGKPMNDVGESKCMKRKNDRTHAVQYCRGFVPKSDRGGK
mgnify:CR=1 FL=1